MSLAELSRPASDDHADALALVTDAKIEAFRRDGAVWIEGLLSPAWMRLVEQGVQRNINNPGPLAKMHFAPGATNGPSARERVKGPGEFLDDYCNYFVNPEYQRLLAESPIAAVMAKLLRSKEIWLFCDQIFIKEGGYSLPTPWHQDAPWWLPDGEKTATLWIATGPLTEKETLEFVAGSHRGPIYNHGAEVQGNATAISNAPMLPDIEAERAKWPIVSHASRPGDVLVFHTRCLHGGGEMREGGSRRSMSIRFFGDDVRYIEPEAGADPEFPGVGEMLRPGDLLRHPWFPRLWPR